jgi:hypothetical protein
MREKGTVTKVRLFRVIAHVQFAAGVGLTARRHVPPWRDQAPPSAPPEVRAQPPPLLTFCSQRCIAPNAPPRRRASATPCQGAPSAAPGPAHVGRRR